MTPITTNPIDVSSCSKHTRLHESNNSLHKTVGLRWRRGGGGGGEVEVDQTDAEKLERKEMSSDQVRKGGVDGT